MWFELIKNNLSVVDESFVICVKVVEFMYSRFFFFFRRSFIGGHFVIGELLKKVNNDIKIFRFITGGFEVKLVQKGHHPWRRRAN